MPHEQDALLDEIQEDKLYSLSHIRTATFRGGPLVFKI